MNKVKEMTKASINIYVGDLLKNIHNDKKYRVAYIDFVEEKAVLVSVNYSDTKLILDLSNTYLREYEDFEIMD